MTTRPTVYKTDADGVPTHWQFPLSKDKVLQPKGKTSLSSVLRKAAQHFANASTVEYRYRWSVIQYYPCLLSSLVTPFQSAYRHVLHTTQSTSFIFSQVFPVGRRL